VNCGHQQAYCSSPRLYMIMESRGGIMMGKPKNSEENRPQSHFVHNKFHTPGLRGEKPATDLFCADSSHSTNYIYISMDRCNKVKNLGGLHLASDGI
jgi:hypothetical protein